MTVVNPKQLHEQFLHAALGFVSDGANLREVSPAGWGRFHVEVPLAGVDRAAIAAAHGDDHITGGLVGPGSAPTSAMVQCCAQPHRGALSGGVQV